MPLHLEHYISPLQNFEHNFKLIYDYFSKDNSDLQLIIDEGFDWHKEKLEHVILCVCDVLKIDPSQVEVFSNNAGFISTTSIKFTVKNYEQFLKLFADQMSGSYFKKSPTHYFLSLINRPTWDRIAISSFLNFHYPSSSKLKFPVAFSFIADGMGVDEYLKNYFNNKSYMNQLQKFLQSIPIDDVKEPWSVKELTTTFTNNSQFHSFELYKSIAVEIVNETNITNSFFCTEKTVRPIAYYTPFVVMAPKNFLSNLKHLGFKTFDSVWDESYDQFEGKERLEKIYQTINQISHIDLNDLHKKTHETCLYNKSVLDSYLWKKKF